MEGFSNEQAAWQRVQWGIGVEQVPPFILVRRHCVSFSFACLNPIGQHACQIGLSHLRWWWQKESFFVEKGYKMNPNSNMKDYRTACNEARLAAVERELINELKGRGMTIEEIRQKASVYEFVEGPNQPKLTKRMQFLLQVKYLFEGREGELVDLADEIEKSPAPYYYSGEEGADIFRDWNWTGIWR
ncbi:unnamed protein product [Effrenium voratum]|nr:unnamed protein product [Effrenium voratum]